MRYLKAILLALFMFLSLSNVFGQEERLLSYFVMNQQVNDLSYSATRNKIYASVPSTGGSYGNYVIEIDPATRQIVRSVFAGSEPNKLAMSDDEQYLYVGLDGSGSVVRIPLQQMVADLSFSLGFSQSNGPMYVEDLAVAPGQPSVIAITRKNICCSPRHEGVAIYDNGIQRGTATLRPTFTNEIEFGDDASTLYGYNNESTGYEFRRMLADANGVSMLASYHTSLSGFSMEIRYSRGRVYAGSGRFIDAATALPVGTFAVGTFQSGLAVDARNRRAIFIRASTILAFDTENFRPLGSVTIPDAVHNQARLTRWGRQGLAFRLVDTRLVLAATALVTRKLERQTAPSISLSKDPVFDAYLQ